MCMCRSFFFFFRGIFFFFTEKDDNVCGCCERHTISTFPSLLNRQKKTVTLRFLFSLLEYLSFFFFCLYLSCFFQIHVLSLFAQIAIFLDALYFSSHQWTFCFPLFAFLFFFFFNLLFFSSPLYVLSCIFIVF